MQWPRFQGSRNSLLTLAVPSHIGWEKSPVVWLLTWWRTSWAWSRPPKLWLPCSWVELLRLLNKTGENVGVWRRGNERTEQLPISSFIFRHQLFCWLVLVAQETFNPTALQHSWARWRSCSIHWENASRIQKLSSYVRNIQTWKTGCMYACAYTLRKCVCWCVNEQVLGWEGVCGLCWDCKLSTGQSSGVGAEREDSRDHGGCTASSRSALISVQERSEELSYQCVRDCSCNLLVSLCSLNAFLKCHFVSVKCSLKILKYF